MSHFKQYYIFLKKYSFSLQNLFEFASAWYVQGSYKQALQIFIKQTLKTCSKFGTRVYIHVQEFETLSKQVKCRCDFIRSYASFSVRT